MGDLKGVATWPMKRSIEKATPMPDDPTRDAAEMAAQDGLDPAALLRLFAALPMGVSLWQLQDPARPESLTLLGANPAALDSVGAILDDAVGRPIGEIARTRRFPSGLAEAVRSRAVQCLGEVSVQPGAGPPVSLEVLAVPVGKREVALVTHDASSDDATRRSPGARHAIHQLMDGLPDGLAVIRDGTLRRANRALARLLGYDDPDLLAGRNAIDLVHPDSQSTVTTQLAVAARGVAAMAEAVLARADGQGVPVEIHVVGVDLDGPMVLGIVRDLTERRALVAKALERDRLSSLGTLAAGLAHEMNNPLAYVSANLQYVSEDLDALEAEGHLKSVTASRLEEVRDALAEAREGARRVARIVADLRAFARPGPGDGDVVDVRDVVETCLDLAGNEIRHRARLLARIPDHPVLVAGDRARLGQVLLPLIINATQAIPTGDAEGNKVEISVDEGEAEVLLTVRDTGVGMADEVRRRILDPFFTTRQAGEGTGLGLSVAHGIVTSLGGRLEIESAVGHGTVVVVHLPTRATEPEAVLAGPELEAAAGRGRVLVVDDEAMIGLAVRRLLGREHEVVMTVQASEALARISAGEDFDVILCDLMMPDISGVDLWEAVDPEVRKRILFLTGGAFTERASAFLERELPPLIGKPFDARVLKSEVLRRIAARRR